MQRRAFTLIEVVVAVGIMAVLAALMVTVLSNVSGFWSRTSGRLSAEAQGRYVLDQLTLDLQGALFRDDGNTWMAADILPNTNNTLSLWLTNGATAAALKPANGAGSLMNIDRGSLADARFGIAGTWLRFFTTKRGSNPLNATAVTTATSTSAPVAVSYQIVRRAPTSTPASLERRYLLHRTEVRPAATGTARRGTLESGFDIRAEAYEPAAGSGVQTADPAEIRFPTLNSVVAENVIDFGVRMYVYAPDDETGALKLTQIFPAASNDLSHRATLPPRISATVEDGTTTLTQCFPEVIDIMVRVLTDEGARLLAGYEASPQRITAPQGRTPQQYWWDLALANSQVFTRRIVLPAKSL